jgi:hypothetical protein
MRSTPDLIDAPAERSVSRETDAHPVTVVHWTETYRAAARHLVEQNGFPVSFLASVEGAIAKMLRESEA